MRRILRMTALLAALACALALPAAAVGGAEPLQTDRQFLAPSGVLLRQDGTLLVADGGLHNVSVLEQDGSFRLLAGRTLPSAAGGRPAGGHLDGDAQSALFRHPAALAEWGGGVVVSDRDNHCLRLIADGAVKTLAGDGTEGLRNGAAAQARFSMPLGLAAGGDGRLYIADSGNGCVRTLDKNGRTETYVSGLNEPAGLCWYGGALYISDVGTHQILRVEGGRATVFAGRSQADGSAYIGGFADGRAGDAEFCTPFALAAGDGVLYVADTGNSAIRQIRDGWVSTLACYSGSKDGLWPGSPVSLALDGETLYAADAFAGCVLRLDTGRMLFEDVPAESWYAQGVSFAYTAGVMSGVSAARFSPGGMTTRGQLAVMLHRLEGLPAARSPAFSDVDADSYCAQAAAWAAANQLAEGYPDGTFRPDQPISRQQLAAVLCRYARWKGMDTAPGSLAAYGDGDQVSGYAAEAMGWACGQGLFQGGADGLLRPGDGVSRAQTAVVLTRFLTA